MSGRTTEARSTRITIEHMKVLLFWTGLILFNSVAVAQQISPTPFRLTSQDAVWIQQQADVYKIDRGEGLSRFEALLGTKDLEALKSAEFFENKKAYDILAAALPSLDQPAVRHYAIDVLLKKRAFSRPVFEALVTELDRLSAIPPKSANEGGDTYFLQGRLVKAISRWLDIPEPGLDLSSQQSVAAFSATAKQKASTSANSTPFD